MRRSYNDQSIYGWRLADVRRILALEDRLPGLRRVDLEVNYRCPRTVVERAVRLIEYNRERFAKTIRAGPAAAGRLVLAADAADETVRIERAVRTWPDDGSTRAILARTNRELLPAVVVALALGLPFRAPRIELLLDSPHLDRLLERGAELADGAPLLVVLEFDHVAVVGMEAGRFPSARAVGEAEDPGRAYEEERRLAYVAWTRARRSLTLVYDPAVPSPFLLEAFSAEELGLTPATG